MGCGLEGGCCCGGVVGRRDEMGRRGEDEILIGQMTLMLATVGFWGKSCQGSCQGWELLCAHVAQVPTILLPA